MRPAVVTLIGVAALGIGVALGLWGHERAGGASPKARAGGAPQADSEPRKFETERPSAKPMPAPSPMRARIREEVERAEVHDAADVERYLDSLEARARAQGKVTALEVEPGIEKIQRFSQNPDEKIARFGERMLRVQRELSGTPPAAISPQREVLRQLDLLLADIRLPKDEAEKQEHIRKYLELARGLDEPQQSEELQALNQAAGVQRGPADPRAADTLWATIQASANENERQGLIREYLALIGQLSEAEQEPRLSALNARYRAEPAEGFRVAR